jgi:ADP-heptose:LPS heptosyltransferase
MKRIAVFRTCALGDAVQCSPLLQQIRADLPDAQVVLFVSANVAALFEGASYVDRLVVLPSAWLTIARGRWGMWRAWLEMARWGPFDALLSLDSSWLRNLGSMLLSTKVKAGFEYRGRRKPFGLFTHSISQTGESRLETEHSSLHYLQLWTLVSGFEDRGFGYDMRHLILGSALIEDSICLAPGTGNAFMRMDTKQWPTQSYVDLGERLLAAGHRVTYLGGADDLQGLSVPAGAVDLLGRTSFSEVATVLSKSRGMVGNDSGLFHLAQSVGCLALGIFGSTSDRLTGAFRAERAQTLKSNLSCQPCYQCQCTNPGIMPMPGCLTTLSVDRVYGALLALME